MRIGLIDVDGHNYPNLPLMKISAYHKKQGDQVEFYDLLNATAHHMITGNNLYDIVYVSKVFSFTADYDEFIFADKIVKGGTGYAISTNDGKEFFAKENDENLPDYIEHVFPDYSLYGIDDTAYGFLTRGCPRGCSFCHVKSKEGIVSRKVADLDEFWNGQKNIELLDPNILACKDWEQLLHQLIYSKAKVNFSQGLDIRMMTDEKHELLKQIKISAIHFAWDRYEDKDIVIPKFEKFREKSKIRPHDLQVYVLCGDVEKRVRDEDLFRVEWLKKNGFAPYVMLYDKQNLPANHDLKKLQRYVNNRFVFWKVDGFENYKRKEL